MDIDKPQLTDKLYICYKITNTVNGKGYIGQTRRGVDKRWKQHIGYVTWNITDKKRNKHILHHAMRKYGIEAFIIEKIAEADTFDEILLIEQELIQEHNTHAHTRTRRGHNQYYGRIFRLYSRTIWSCYSEMRRWIWRQP